MPETRSTSESMDILAQAMAEISQKMTQMMAQAMADQQATFTGMFEQLRGEMQELKLSQAKADFQNDAEEKSSLKHHEILPDVVEEEINFSYQPEVAACVAIPEVAAWGLDDPCDVEVKTIGSETSSQLLGVRYSSKSNNLFKSEVIVAASCEEIKKSDWVVDDQVSLLLSSDSFLIEDAPKPTEYFTINYSSDLSNNEGVTEVDETPELKISFPFSNLNLNSCSPSVCKNASEDWPSYLTMQTDFHSYNLLPKLKVRRVKPPAKPPDDIVWFDVGTDIISYQESYNRMLTHMRRYIGCIDSGLITNGALVPFSFDLASNEGILEHSSTLWHCNGVLILLIWVAKHPPLPPEVIVSSFALLGQCLSTFGELILQIKELHFDFAHWSYEILVFQFHIKHEQKLECDGGCYLKFLIGDNDQKDLVGHTLYKIMLKSDAGIAYSTNIFDMFYVVRVEMIKLAMFLFVSIHNDETTNIYEFNMEDRVSIQRLVEQSRTLGVSWILGISFIYTNGASKMFASFRDPISYEAFNDSLRVICSNLLEVRSKTMMKKFQYYDEFVGRVFERLSTSIDTYFRGDYSGKTMVDWLSDAFARNDDMYLPMGKQPSHQITDVVEKINRELPPTTHGPVNAETFWTTSQPSLGSFGITCIKDYVEINFIGYLEPTIVDVGFICLFAPFFESWVTRDAAMLAVILSDQANYEAQGLLLFAVPQQSFGLKTVGATTKSTPHYLSLWFSLPRPPEIASFWLPLSFWFSSPRPPEVADLEDKVNFKDGGMLWDGILGNLRELLAFWYNLDMYKTKL